MSRIVRPIRAWADYDDWRWFWHDLSEKVYAIPLTADGHPFVSSWPSVVQAARSFEHEPLRSLRVLYENGWTLELGPESGRTTTASGSWFWYLHEDKDAPEIPHGRFSEDKDSEAVERAMIAAAAWFSQRQGLDT